MLKHVKEFFIWIREHIVWVLAGLGAVVMALVSASRKWERIQGKQILEEMEQLAVQKGRLDAVRRAVENELEKNSIDQRILNEEVEMLDEKIEEIRDEVSQLNSPAIATRFNQLYE